MKILLDPRRVLQMTEGRLLMREKVILTLFFGMILFFIVCAMSSKLPIDQEILEVIQK